MPGAKPSRRYAPRTSATAARAEPVSRLRASTSAPAKTPSLAVMTLCSVAVVACAESDDTRHTASDHKMDRRFTATLRSLERLTCTTSVLAGPPHLAPPTQPRNI